MPIVARREETVFEAGCPIAQVIWLAATERELQDVGKPADLAVEVPHGADQQRHFEELADKLKSDLPNELVRFFFANTDVGAFDYGLQVAERVVAAGPGRRVVVIRCLIPRTLIDTNRRIDAADTLATGGMTPGMAPYINHPDDQQLLSTLHRRYLEVGASHLRPTAEAGGFLLLPHSYGPRTMGIAKVDAQIVDNLRAASQPGVWESWPLRPEVDLLVHDGDGKTHAPMQLVERLVRDFAAVELTAELSSTYTLNSAAQAWQWAAEFADQTLCIEVRRDLLVRRFSLLEPMFADPAKVERVVGPLTVAIDRFLQSAAGQHGPQT